jgi:hypothetical protein
MRIPGACGGRRIEGAAEQADAQPGRVRRQADRTAIRRRRQGFFD